MTDPEKYEETLFNDALQLASGPERAAYLKRVCAQDEPLRRRVEALLQAHDASQGILEQPVVTLAAKTLVVHTAMIQPSEKPGDKIGR